MLVVLYLVLSRYWHRTFIQTYSATSPFNLHWEMDKTLSPSYSSSQITYLCGSGRIFALPLPQKKDRFRIPAPNACSVYTNVAQPSVIASHITLIFMNYGHQWVEVFLWIMLRNIVLRFVCFLLNIWDLSDFFLHFFLLPQTEPCLLPKNCLIGILTPIAETCNLCHCDQRINFLKR